MSSTEVALVTGASAGIGQEFARQLHAQGYKLILLARRTELLNQLKLELEDNRPDSVELLVCDLTRPDTEQFKAVVRRIQTERIDLLINNAGRGSFGYFDELNLEQELELIELNVTATVRLAHAAIAQMKKRRNGGLISISSIAGFQPLPFMSTYAATKAFNLQHSLGLWYELREYNVRVMIVCPGPVATEFGGVARVPGTVTGAQRDSAESVVRQALKDFRHGKLISVPGIKAKALAYMTYVLPTKFTTWCLGIVLKKVLKLANKA